MFRILKCNGYIPFSKLNKVERDMPRKTQKTIKRLNVRKALHDGSLLTGVTLNGLKVTLHLTDEYNQVRSFRSINRSLYGLYRNSSDFQEKFEKPTEDESPVVLQLKAELLLHQFLIFLLAGLLRACSRNIVS